MLLGLALLVTGQVRSEESAAETEVLTFVLNRAETSEETGGEGSDYKDRSNVLIKFNLILGGDGGEVSEESPSPEEHIEDVGDTSQVDDKQTINTSVCGCKMSVLEDTAFRRFLILLFCVCPLHDFQILSFLFHVVVTAQQ